MFGRIKEIEDLKSELSKVNTQYSNLYMTEKKRIINEIKNDYLNLCKENEFINTETPVNLSSHGIGSQIVSTYGSVQFTLNVPAVEDSFIGAITRFEFIENKKKWIIIVNEKGNEAKGWTVTFDDKDEVTQLKKKIDDATKELAKLNRTAIEYSLIHYEDGKKSFEVSGNNIRDIINLIVNKK